MVLHVGDGDFEKEVINSDIPVMVDFWATWCAPCRAIEPIIEKLAQEYEGKVKFCKVNVDESRKLPLEYSIRSIPTLLFFKNGRVVNSIIGAVPPSEIKKVLENLLGAS